MATIRIEILGDMRIAGISPKQLPIPKKARALMAYLSRIPDCTASRERIADLLWPGQGDEQGHHSLRNLLLAARGGGRGNRSIFVADWFYIKLSPDVHSDANEFLASVGSNEITELEFACLLIRGRFLNALEISSEPFEEWLSTERIKFDDLYNSALTRLATMYTQKSQHELAIGAARRAIVLDNLSERAHRALIAAFQGAGYASDAARHYASMRQLFLKELSVLPSGETQRLLHRTAEPANDEIGKLRSEVGALTRRIEAAEATGRHWREKYSTLFDLVQRAKAKAADKRAARAAVAA